MAVNISTALHASSHQTLAGRNSRGQRFSFIFQMSSRTIELVEVSRMVTEASKKIEERATKST